MEKRTFNPDVPDSLFSKFGLVPVSEEEGARLLDSITDDEMRRATILGSTVGFFECLRIGDYFTASQELADEQERIESATPKIDGKVDLPQGKMLISINLSFAQLRSLVKSDGGKKVYIMFNGRQSAKLLVQLARPAVIIRYFRSDF